MDLQFFPAWVLHGRQVAEGPVWDRDSNGKEEWDPGSLAQGTGWYCVLRVPAPALPVGQVEGGAWQGVGGTVCKWVEPCGRWAGLMCWPLEAEPEFAETFLRAKP